MQSRKITVEKLSPQTFDWFVNTAAVKMLSDEVKDTRLINISQIEYLAKLGMEAETAFVAKQGEECIGAIGGILQPNIFNPDLKSLTEIFWYVLPSYRKTRAGYLLFKAFDEVGHRKANYTNMCLLFDSEVSIEGMEKRGYVLKEFAFSKENKWQP